MNKIKYSFVPIVLFLSCVFLFSTPAFAQKAYKVKDMRLDEISGIAASRVCPGLYYVQNDSGGKSEVYVLNSKGKLVGILHLNGVSNRDWEDIAVGPGPVTGMNYIYVGEIGDNKAQYKDIYLYCFPEPTLKQLKKLPKRKDDTLAIDNVTAFRINFEDGARDCETLFVDPATSDVYLVSKREEKVGVYLVKAPLSPDSLNIARRMLSLDFALAVGGDISAQRDKIVIKTYNDVYCWNVDGQTIAEALSKEPDVLPYKAESQGEGICWSFDGRDYLTISERNGEQPLYLYLYAYKPKN
jgi:hypothetical protein